MQHITNESFGRRDPETQIPQILTFSITEPGWKNSWDFEEESLELSPGQLACPDYGCKVYKWNRGETRVVWHHNAYGCPRGWRGGQKIT